MALYDGEEGYYNAELGTGYKGRLCFFYKTHKDSSFWWIDYPDSIGELQVTFDKKRIYNLWTDYPGKMLPEEEAAFDKQEPFWRDFFKGPREEEKT